MNSRLTFGGEEEIVNLADKIVVKVINKAKTRVTNAADMSQLEQAVNTILNVVDKIEGATVLSAESECVLIRLQCDTYKSLHDVLKYITSKEYKQQLDYLAELLTSYYNAKKPIVVFSDTSIDCWRITSTEKRTGNIL